MPLDAPRHKTFSAQLECHYLVHAPPATGSDTLLAVALHGFASNPETMLRLAAMMLGDQHVIASIQGPNQFYLRAGSDEVGYGWITRRHADASIRLHHEMVLHVLDAAGREHGIPPERRILLGFSQPVSLNYRLAATHPDAVRGVIAVCGGLPKDWETGPYGPVSAAVLHIARREDEFYPPEVTGRYAERLALRAPDVEFHLLEGGHRFPSKGTALAAGWWARVMQAKR